MSSNVVSIYSHDRFTGDSLSLSDYEILKDIYIELHGLSDKEVAQRSREELEHREQVCSLDIPF